SPNALGYAYRVCDAAAWNTWLAKIAGHPDTEMEVVHRTLRVRDKGPVAQVRRSAPETIAVPVESRVPEPVSANRAAEAGPAPLVPASTPKVEAPTNEPVLYSKLESEEIGR